MIVAIHQPNFIPHHGFFAKMAACDHFILLDDAQFPRNGYTNRAQLLYQSNPTSPGALPGNDGKYYAPDWATVPVPKSLPLDTPIHRVLISENPPWTRKLLARIEQSYAKTPGFTSLWPRMREAFDARPPLLADFNISLLAILRDALAIQTPLTRATSLPPSPGGPEQQSAATLKLIHLVKAVGGTVYLSGPSGRKYLDESLFAAANVELRYASFPAHEYPQPTSPFTPGLSILDQLFRVDPSTFSRPDEGH